MDFYFIEEFLIPEFIWDFKNKTVVNPRNNMNWSIDTFFSNSGLYGAYTEINQLMLRDEHISLSIVRDLPDLLPNVGIDIFDTRREKTWKTELEEYMSQKKEYTGEILDYDRLWIFIENIARKLILECFIPSASNDCPLKIKNLFERKLCTLPK